MVSERMVSILNQLGDSPDRVAAILKASGIRGVRNAARFLQPHRPLCGEPDAGG